MNVDGKLVAIVGPNESGKTSFLEALTHFNHHEVLKSSGPKRELTRSRDIPTNQEVVKATFLIEDEELEELRDMLGGEEIRWCEISKHAGEGTHYYTFKPRQPRRSLAMRQRVVRLLNGVSSRQRFTRLVENHPELDLVNEVRSLASLLETNVETMSDEYQTRIVRVATRLENATDDEGPQYVKELAQLLRDLAQHEAEPRPGRKAINYLSPRKPRFLLFSDDDRLLQSGYNIEEVWQNPPGALRNLARVANLDLEALNNAIAANDDPAVAGLEEQANDRLDQRFYEAWSQARLTVRFRIEERVLKILIREESEGELPAHFTSIVERSDGLRQFVALTAFADSQSTAQTPVLLIDEVERHLHYNAQADLVQILAQQSIASKVIYTTHSIGCLPEDLGTGVRLVESQEPQSFTSRIENAFWTSDRPGFSPLLFGMGASALAFIPLRNAVITEGPSDIILWPRLLREATDRTHLDLQIAPGLSKADRPGIIVLDREAPRTVYLLDADEGGNNLKKELISAGIADDRIFSIPDERELGLVVEDLIDTQIYARAVNEELRRSNGDAYSFPAGNFPEAGRPTAVKEWCREKGIREPHKVAVAYRVIEEGIEVPILAEPHRDPLAQLFVNVSDALQAQA